MRAKELDPGRRVRWLVVDGPRAWTGTKVDWELRPDGEDTVVMFKHRDWKEPVELMRHCSTKSPVPDEPEAAAGDRRGPALAAGRED